MGDRLGYCDCYKTFDRGKKGITKVLTMISITVVAKLRTNPKPGSTYDILDLTKKQDQSYVENAKRILVPFDGQLQSLKALNGAVSLFKDVAKT